MCACERHLKVRECKVEDSKGERERERERERSEGGRERKKPEERQERRGSNLEELSVAADIRTELVGGAGGLKH
jgi:hypothetical protein